MLKPFGVENPAKGAHRGAISTYKEHHLTAKCCCNASSSSGSKPETSSARGRWSTDWLTLNPLAARPPRVYRIAGLKRPPLLWKRTPLKCYVDIIWSIISIMWILLHTKTCLIVIIIIGNALSSYYFARIF